MNKRLEPNDSQSTPTVTSIDVDLLVKLFDQAPDIAFFVKDALGLYVAVNESLLNRHGLRRKKDAIGKHPSDICPGDFGRVPTDQDTKVLRTGQPIVDHLEMQWQRPHHPVWCLTTKLPIKAPDGSIEGLIGFSRDVRVTVRSDEIPEDFAKALDYYELNLNQLESPSALAQRSNLNLQRLARLTKRLFGLTPSQLITKTRIAAASRMLLETQKPISDISLACGFYDQSAFTRTFRAATGVTPSEFRKQILPDV
ncbi:MAG: AraC family transcriptional regulator [Pirellula sp.]